ncbi:Transmembrane protein 26 [Aphelenchoides avenae]|nr:Transmembrane protein 26 [Aphelenchus avenae]
MCEWRREANIGQLDDKLHFQLLEQLLLVVLIIGRWLLPKGEISREQLSQILLAYLAISSDIVEFFDVFKERVVYRNEFIQYIVLAAWTLSLLQFPFVLTVSRARKMRVALTKEDSMVVKRGTDIWQVFYDIDIWAIFLANTLQDIPFFAVRLYLMTQHRLITYTMIFFICKNALIIALQTYRAFVLFNDRYLNPKLDESLLASVISGEHKHRSPNKKRKKPRGQQAPQQVQTTARHKKPRHSASSTEEGQKAPIVGFTSRRTSSQQQPPRGSAATIRTTPATTPTAMKSPQHVTRASVESYTDLQ